MQTQTEISLKEATRIVSRIDLGFRTWSSLSLKDRIKNIQRLRKAISKNARRIAEAISEECGRPLMESLSQEVLPVLEMAKYCEKKFPSWLNRGRLPYRRPGFWRKKNHLHYEPIGPVAVISPQNFPFSLGMMTLIYALLPGNTVVLKPSEKSTVVPSIIRDLFDISGLLSSYAASLLPGDAEIGRWLIRHPKIKKIFFFGRETTGEYVAELCRKHSKPYVLESGGGCTAFVCADADVEQAAAGLAWSSFYASGRSCVSTERIFVDEKISEKFISLLKKKVTSFQTEIINSRKRDPIGPSEVFRLKELIKDAKTKGAGVFHAGMPGPHDSNALFPFTIVTSTTRSMCVFKDEIFGPLVAVQAVGNLEDAAEEMNENSQPLGISIWSRNPKQALRMAKKLSSGMIWINDSSFGLPHLPWGNLDKAGWGSLFSEFSLQEVTRLKWISKHPKGFSKTRFWWNPYTPTKEKLLLKIAKHFF
jgi:acyl-CoA reductase-like NAD-dependent aldehyde dehydrogenase